MVVSNFPLVYVWVYAFVVSGHHNTKAKYHTKSKFDACLSPTNLTKSVLYKMINWECQFPWSIRTSGLVGRQMLPSCII